MNKLIINLLSLCYDAQEAGINITFEYSSRGVVITHYKKISCEIIAEFHINDLFNRDMISISSSYILMALTKAGVDIGTRQLQ